MAEHVIMDANGIRRTLVRLAHEIAERDEIGQVVLLGIKRGGEIVAERVRDCLYEAEGIRVPCGGIDIGMQRDDLVSAFFCARLYGKQAGFFGGRQDRGLVRRRSSHGQERARGAGNDLQTWAPQGDTALGTRRPRRQGASRPRGFRGQKRTYFPQRIRGSLFYRARRGGG